MTKTRIINPRTGSEIWHYYDDEGHEITREEYEALPQPTQVEYECPHCHNSTFGKFEPFYSLGIEAWCSTCGYTSFYDKKKYDAWFASNPKGRAPLGLQALGDIPTSK